MVLSETTAMPESIAVRARSRDPGNCLGCPSPLRSARRSIQGELMALLSAAVESPAKPLTLPRNERRARRPLWLQWFLTRLDFGTSRGHSNWRPNRFRWKMPIGMPASLNLKPMSLTCAATSGTSKDDVRTVRGKSDAIRDRIEAKFDVVTAELSAVTHHRDAPAREASLQRLGRVRRRTSPTGRAR